MSHETYIESRDTGPLTHSPPSWKYAKQASFRRFKWAVGDNHSVNYFQTPHTTLQESNIFI